MTAQPKHQWTEEEYLAFERVSETRHEYLNGEIFEMVGGSEAHNLIVTNIVAAVRPQLRGKDCRIYSNDLRVKVSLSGLYTYPDIVLVCGEREFQDSGIDTLLNPAAIVEVLSRSTERYDRGDKFDYYSSLVSLRDYILVTQTRARIEHYLRQDDGNWLYTDYKLLNEVVNLSIGCSISLEAAYEDVLNSNSPEK
jgi:Uma2 family endonuclease